MYYVVRNKKYYVTEHACYSHIWAGAGVKADTVLSDRYSCSAVNGQETDVSHLEIWTQYMQKTILESEDIRIILDT